MKKYVLTSESVTEGHPDKVCDQISDAILDNLIAQDTYSRVAIETLVTTGTVHIAGEVTTKGYFDAQKIARDVLKDIGYTNSRFGICWRDTGVWTSIHEQSSDISQGVTEDNSKSHEQGAGDQGMMYGFACNETPELMPLPIMLAHQLTKQLAAVRRNNTIKDIGPDGKSQVSVEYEDGKPKRLTTVVIAQQHLDNVDERELKESIEALVIIPICNPWLDKNTIRHVNATGRFVIGGPEGDTGVTGRKIIVDTYGGIGRHGGGAFSGKDPSKVDRSGAYAARYVAKNIVAADLAERCEVQISYAIGIAKPTSINVDCFGTNTISEEDIAKAVGKTFDLRPRAIIDNLNLRRPIFRKTAAYGHFGRNDPDFTWEAIDKVEVLKQYLEI